MRTQVKYLLHSDCQVSISAFTTWQTSSTNMLHVRTAASCQTGWLRLTCTYNSVCKCEKKGCTLFFHPRSGFELGNSYKQTPNAVPNPLLLKGLTGEAILLHWKALTGKCNSVSTLRHSDQPFTWFHQSGTVYSTPVPPSSTSHTLYFQFGLYHPCCSWF